MKRDAQIVTRCGRVYDHMKANDVSLRPETYATYMKVRLCSSTHPNRCLAEDGTLSDPRREMGVSRSGLPHDFIPSGVRVWMRSVFEYVGWGAGGLQGLDSPWNDHPCPNLGRLVGINSAVPEIVACPSCSFMGSVTHIPGWRNRSPVSAGWIGVYIGCRSTTQQSMETGAGRGDKHSPVIH